MLSIEKYCSIVRIKLKYRLNCIVALILLIVLFQQQQYVTEGTPTKWNHSIQRRFMWKQMDSTVDGFVDRVVTGARVMKSMIGDFMPPKQVGANVMDYLPTETTRIKYIIRNPHTKETKIIRIRPSKKVVKLMAMTPKPLMAENSKSVPSLDPQKLRQLEKEQELIAEGRLPKKSEPKQSYSALQSEKQTNTKHDHGQYLSHGNNEIVTGRIKEFNESWKPVYKLGYTPVGFTTSKPFMMSALHTSVVGEFLPEPQKQVYEPFNSNDFPEEQKNTHTYEVTEYTAEESVDQPQTHDYYNFKSEPTLSSSLTKYSPVTTENPKTIAQTEDNANIKPNQYKFSTQRELLPARENYRSTKETSTATTTTEEPNYPAVYLKKYHNRPNTVYNPKEHQRNKTLEMSLESSNWIPSNATFSYQRGRSTNQRHVLRTQSQKWPPDLQETFLNTSSSLSQYEVLSTTESTLLRDLTTQNNSNSSRKNVRLKIQHYLPADESQYKKVRQRGSIKYGDKLIIGEHK